MEKNPPRLPGYQLPTQPEVAGGRQAEGFFTPTQDLMPQRISIPPRRVLPIIFLPGIMGSNLRMSAARQDLLKKKNNIAWRPERLGESILIMEGDAALRQNQLDPSVTEVDEYDPVTNPTGDHDETADQRHDNAAVDFNLLNVGIDSPLLMDDPVTAKPRKMKDRKARERGWGEVFFDSYRELLEMCEHRLNTAFSYGQLDNWWQQIVDMPPTRWQASAHPPLKPLEEETLKEAVRDCWFPVHAIGYNWLQSNGESGVRVAKRITALMERYKTQGFKCEKVILVTHSMGGLVARAVIHPKMGNLNEKVLGVVHGVMPAIGAGAAYKRMRCGFEGGGLMANITAKVLGNVGPDVTAVLGNAQGGLELLPSQAYGNGWLQITCQGQTIKALPQQGDPYEEIYKLRGKWYGLLREEWINPARHKLGGFKRTAILLDRAKQFHLAIGSTYHEQSYGHYGADASHAAWHNVVWAIEGTPALANLEKWKVSKDSLQGDLQLCDQTEGSFSGAEFQRIQVRMQAACDPGDQTVPLHSAEHQLRSGKFKGIFRQTGYEHQNSYKDEGALRATLYSLVRIAQTMKWTNQ